MARPAGGESGPRPSTRSVSLRLEETLYVQATLLATVAEISLRELMEAGLRRELEARTRNGPREFEKLVEAFHGCREIAAGP